jgi:hypothetical protein
MKTLFDDYIEVNMDTCKFQKDGFDYTAIVKEVGNDHLVVKPISRTNYKDIYENNLDTTFQIINLHENSFDDIKLEIWMDGRGCDNSAIGISGCYEPYTLLSA